jgi:predicted PurR-regulated permease PerM
MEIITVIAIIITAIATGVIAYYATQSHKLASKIQIRDDEFRQQIKDLYQAIVVSNVIEPSPGDTSKAIKHFKEFYKGKTPILD